jgi:hypothetical protein
VFTEDLTKFFDTGEFAVVAVFTRGGAPVATANVNFNEPSQALSLEGTDVEEKEAFLLTSAAAVAAVKRKDHVAVNGANYVVERIHPDGTGLKLLYLAEA